MRTDYDVNILFYFHRKNLKKNQKRNLLLRYRNHYNFFFVFVASSCIFAPFRNCKIYISKTKNIAFNCVLFYYFTEATKVKRVSFCSDVKWRRNKRVILDQRLIKWIEKIIKRYLTGLIIPFLFNNFSIYLCDFFTI